MAFADLLFHSFFIISVQYYGGEGRFDVREKMSKNVKKIALLK